MSRFPETIQKPSRVEADRTLRTRAKSSASLRLSRSADFKITEICRSFEYQGVTYVPGTISPGLGQLVRFPTARPSLDSTQNLLSEMKTFLSKYLDQEARTIELLTAFVFGSWFTDCFQVAPSRAGPDSEVSWVLRLLSVLCSAAGDRAARSSKPFSSS